MFDPERLLKQVMKEALGGSLGGNRRHQPRSYGSSGLGGLLGSAMGGSRGGPLGAVLGGMTGGSRGGGLSASTKASIGLGVLGVAIAAYDHYRSSQGISASPPPGNAPSPPPPPSATPPPPPQGTSSTPQQAEEAMHLLRAMICAAHADGLIDADERGRILASARDAGLDEDDIAALEGELAAPLTPAQLVARTRPAQREQVYVASVIAIGRDTELEQRYLDDLAQHLGFDASSREALHQQFGL